MGEMVDLIKKVYYQNKYSKKMSSSEICRMINDIGLLYGREYNLSPIDLEIIMNNKDGVEKIIDSGEVDLNIPSTTGYLPLVTAATYSNSHILDLLIKNKAKVNVEGDYIPLNISASKKDFYSMKLLLDNGADANKADKNGFISLHYLYDDGTFRGFYDGVPTVYTFGENLKNNADDSTIIRCSNLLFDAGADVNSIGKYSLSYSDDKLIEINPLSIALEVWGFDVIENLINNGSERKAVEIWPDSVYEYQSTLTSIKELYDISLIPWLFEEYKNYLNYMRKIKKLNIEVFSPYIDDETDYFKRPKIIKKI